MKYTNVLKLPPPYVRAVTEDDYERGEDTDYTCTELLKAPRQRILEKQHDHEITVDVADLLYRLFGKMVHKVLETGGVPERRFTIRVLGKTISGKPDRFTKEGLLQDWKCTTLYRFKGGQLPFEIEAQLNIYAEILRQNGYRVTALEAVPMFRDWQKKTPLRNPDCPPHPMIIAPAKLWEPAFVRKFIEDRVRLHEEAKLRLPDCTEPERWATPEVFAVMKKGRKSSLRNLATREAAEEFIKTKGPDKSRGLTIEHRPPINNRCEGGYCTAAPFCQQFQKMREKTAEVCENCGEDKVPSKVGSGTYCRKCWRKSKPW